MRHAIAGDNGVRRARETETGPVFTFPRYWTKDKHAGLWAMVGRKMRVDRKSGVRPQESAAMGIYRALTGIVVRHVFAAPRGHLCSKDVRRLRFKKEYGA